MILVYVIKPFCDMYFINAFVIYESLKVTQCLQYFYK